MTICSKLRCQTEAISDHTTWRIFLFDLIMPDHWFWQNYLRSKIEAIVLQNIERPYLYPPVLNAKSISVLGKYNSKSRYQYWLRAMIRAMIITHLRLGKSKASAKIKMSTGFERTFSSLKLFVLLSAPHGDSWNFCLLSR